MADDTTLVAEISYTGDLAAAAAITALQAALSDLWQVHDLADVIDGCVQLQATVTVDHELLDPASESEATYEQLAVNWAQDDLDEQLADADGFMLSSVDVSEVF